MRKTKRFTPDLIEKYKNLNRGTGTYKRYIPFHRVGRSDPSSKGLSHLDWWNGRHIELLSNGEKIAFMFSMMLPNIIDIREQFPIQYQFSSHELLDYDVSISKDLYIGTNQICQNLNIQHPKVNGCGRSAPWPMTTDLLLTIKNNHGKLQLLAVSCKPKGFKLEKRGKLLLEIERIYWQERDVEWLLITPELYETKVASTLLGAVGWAQGEAVERSLLIKASEEISKLNGSSLSFALQCLTTTLNSDELAQRAFWQSILSGLTLFDLRRGWRPHIPIRILPSSDFLLLNPIASRRSAWI